MLRRPRMRPAWALWWAFAVAIFAVSSEASAADNPESPTAVTLPKDLALPATAPTAPSGVQTQGRELPIQEWNAEDYEATKPKLNLLEVSGYFRLRGDYLNNATLGNDTFGTVLQVGGTSVGAPPSGKYQTTYYSALRRLLTNSSNSLSNANMRARLTPTLNITEDIQLISTFDLFDNLILGSTPNNRPSATPQVNVLDNRQNSPTANSNALINSIQLKRLYAKIATPLGELRFGRMPNKWGLGIFANDGDCIDCDYGDNVDRLSFVAMVGSFYLVPMIDFISTGPTNAQIGQAQGIGQPQLLESEDNTTQFSLQIARKDSPEDIRNQLSKGELVINYGLWNMFRTQVKESSVGYLANPSQTVTPNTTQSQAGAGSTGAGSGGSLNTLTQLQSRDAFAYIADGFFTLKYQKFTFDFEGVFTWSRFKISGLQNNSNTGYNYARQWAFASDSRYDFNPNFYLRLRAGIASGDNSPGFGVGADAVSKLATGKNSLDNFQFNRDYRVDLILWREIIGTVTGAYYVKPEVGYVFSNGLGGRFAPIYSQAIFRSNTPGQSGPLGLEFDFEVFITPKKMRGFEASLAYGILVPFEAFDRSSSNDLGSGHGTSIANRLLGRVGVIF